MAIVIESIPLRGDVSTRGNLREYDRWRYHAGGNIDLYFKYATPPGLYESPPDHLRLPMRFGIRDQSGSQPRASIQFNQNFQQQTFGHHAAGTYAVNARFGGTPYGNGVIWWDGDLKLRKNTNV